MSWLERRRWRRWHRVIDRPDVCPANAHTRIIVRERDCSLLIDASCRRDLAANGACWCGKLREKVAGP